MTTGTTVLSQKEYLKKYLSKTKKRKKKHKISSSSVLKRSQIIDDDGDDIIVKGDIDDDEYDFDYMGDEAPQIAGIIDERPLQVRTLEHYNQQSWTDIGGADTAVNANKPDSAMVRLLKRIDRETSKGDKKEKGNPDDISTLRRSEKKKRRDSDNTPGNKLRRKEGDSQFQPPRPGTSGNKTIVSNERLGNVEPADQSPTGRSKKNCLSSDKTEKKDYDSDMSPPRKSKIGKYRKDKGGDSDLSPPRSSKRDRKGKGSDSDQSPPRSSKRDKNRMGIGSDSDQSPPRSSKRDKNRKGKDSDSDLSLPRTSKRDKGRKHKGSDSDLSPPRNSKQDKNRKDKGSDSDLSPPRSSKRDRNRKDNGGDSDLSPPRSCKRNGNRKDRGSDSDISPLRNRDRTLSKKVPSRSGSNRCDDYRAGSRDLRDGRKRRDHDETRDPSLHRKHKADRSVDNPKSNKMEKTLDGKRAGLQDAGSLKKELGDLKIREEKMFQQLASSAEGVALIMRDRKTGRKRDLEKEREESAVKAARQAQTDETYSKWGKGLKQVEDSRRKLSDAINEMSKPLARYATDQDLENFLKAQEREGDPMLDYIKQKQAESINVNQPSKPKYQGSFTPNRFGLAPGYRWDGVDRSNGYEKSWFEHRNAKKAVEEEAYKWSTSDM